MPSTVVYTSVRPTAAQIMRDIAARTAAQRRTAEGMARKDPAYGMNVCTCVCRRCIPYKNDCGGCVAGGCTVRFMSHEDASSYFASFGVDYDARTRRFRY